MILCCGEALIDMIPATTADGSSCLVPKCGGAVFNTAIALGRLGQDVGLFTGVSDDQFGRQLQAELSASQVQTTRLKTLDAPTSLAFVELNDGQAQYTFYTKGAADTVLEPAHCPTDPGQFDALFFGGISLCTDPTASTLQDYMEKASAAGCLTMIDPNIRTSFIEDEGTYRDRLIAMMAVADIIKLSDEDLSWVSGSSDPLPAQVVALGLPTDTLVLITKGADGSDAYRGSGELVTHARTAPVTVADTIGAGDTFNAGVLTALSQDGRLSKTGVRSMSADTLEKVLSFANIVAGVTVSRQGANPPWRHEI